MPVDFEWDPMKSATNERQRGFGFAFATQVFDSRLVVTSDDRTNYGEVRTIVVGEIDGKLYTVGYTDRENVRRIISAHRASPTGD